MGESVAYRGMTFSPKTHFQPNASPGRRASEWPHHSHTTPYDPTIHVTSKITAAVVPNTVLGKDDKSLLAY